MGAEQPLVTPISLSGTKLKTSWFVLPGPRRNQTRAAVTGSIVDAADDVVRDPITFTVDYAALTAQEQATLDAARDLLVGKARAASPTDWPATS